MSFSQIILEWYGVHKRELPWRTTIEPYKIWLSEIMLQQTRVAQGIPYYNKFLDAFPTVHDLASAPEEKVVVNRACHRAAKRVPGAVDVQRVPGWKTKGKE